MLLISVLDFKRFFFNLDENSVGTGHLAKLPVLTQHIGKF